MTETAADFVARTVARLGRGRASVIPILQAVQTEYRYLPEEVLRRLVEATDITAAQIAGVSTFYTQFRHQPVGEHIIRVCHGTACHVKGAAAVQEAILRHLGVPAGGDTDPDGRFTIEKVACLGCCTLAPVVQIDGVTYGHLVPDTVPRMIHDFLDLKRRGAIQTERAAGAAGAAGAGEVRIGLGSCCMARGSDAGYDARARAGGATGARAAVKRVGCVGMCHQTPLVEVVPPEGPTALYAQVQPDDARRIVLRHFRPASLARRAGAAVSGWLERVLTDEAWTPVTRYALDTRDPPVAAFLSRQQHLATEACGHLDPLDLDEYRAKGGFAALETCLRERTAEAIVEEIRASGLRGRGGAGYPTGRKWDLVRRQPADRKFVVMNGDEGDPGAFMDRMILESYPYRVIEGIAIAARAVGAQEGVLYIRAEYPLAVRRVREALARCEAAGLLGERILGTDFSLHLRIMEGAGAFVCGEETALLESVEGRRGMPHLRPPYPAERGLWGRPTLINNVETLALVPWIVRHGAAEFARLGTEKSKGTKVFALAGKIRRGGLIEVPMGITLREIVEEIGGGVAEGRRFKAVQVGGPSGGCVPAALADTAVDYEALASVGAIMGSGGLVVLDDTDCMVEIARYFLEFTQDQSCGKCTMCRVGTRRMLDILDRLCGGEGRRGDLEALEDLAWKVRRGSLCGLGKTAPNPVLTTLRYFREEYEAHLEGRCPAGRCKALIHYTITDDCIGCTLCAQHCPADAIEMRPYEKHEIDDTKCIRCDTCRQVCPTKAVRVE